MINQRSRPTEAASDRILEALAQRRAPYHPTGTVLRRPRGEPRRRLLRTAGLKARSIRRAGKLYRARSRLYRSRFVQPNMRLKALAEIYRMHSFAQLRIRSRKKRICDLNFFFEAIGKHLLNLRKFKIQQSLAKFCKVSNMLAIVSICFL